MGALPAIAGRWACLLPINPQIRATKALAGVYQALEQAFLPRNRRVTRLGSKKCAMLSDRIVLRRVRVQVERSYTSGPVRSCLVGAMTNRPLQVICRQTRRTLNGAASSRVQPSRCPLEVGLPGQHFRLVRIPLRPCSLHQPQPEVSQRSPDH